MAASERPAGGPFAMACARNRLLDAEGVKAEGQVDKGRCAANRANLDAQPRQRREGNRHRSQNFVEDKVKFQQRQLVGEQGGVAAAENLGPVADVGQVGGSGIDRRSEERRVGTECLRLCRSRGSPNH